KTTTLLVLLRVPPIRESRAAYLVLFSLSRRVRPRLPSHRRRRLVHNNNRRRSRSLPPAHRHIVNSVRSDLCRSWMACGSISYATQKRTCFHWGSLVRHPLPPRVLPFPVPVQPEPGSQPKGRRVPCHLFLFPHFLLFRPSLRHPSRRSTQMGHPSL